MIQVVDRVVRILELPGDDSGRRVSMSEIGDTLSLD